MDPLVGLALAHAEQPALDHLDRGGLQVGEHKEQPLLRGCQRTAPIDGEPTGGSRFAIEAPRRHMLLERRLEGRDQDLKLLQGQAGEVQELRGAGLHVSEPYSIHGSYLLSRHGSITDACILLIGINSKDYEDFVVQDLVLRPHVVRIRRERWVTPDGETVVAPMPAGITGHFGSELRRFVLLQYHQGQVTMPRLLTQLRAIGIDVSKRQVVRLLNAG